MERWQLSQLQSIPLEQKIQLSKLRIEEFYNYFHGEVYVSFSGGKDSTVLLDLVRQIDKDIPAVFCDTGLEYPEIRQFVKTFENVTILKPKMTFLEVIKKHGYPIISKEVASCVTEVQKHKRLGITKESVRYKRLNGTLTDAEGNPSQFNCSQWKFLTDAPFLISDKCCNVMKKIPAHQYDKETGRHPYIGIMAGESALRERQYLATGCNAFETIKPKSTPLGFWTEQDVLQYIKQKNLKYCSVYGELIEDDLFGERLKFSECQRTGCMFCGFGAHLEKYPNRFQLMKRSHPQIWDYCMNKLGMAEVLDYIGVAKE